MKKMMKPMAKPKLPSGKKPMPAKPAMPPMMMANGGMVGGTCGPGVRSNQDYKK
jgi:hypothetical protein